MFTTLILCPCDLVNQIMTTWLVLTQSFPCLSPDLLIFFSTCKVRGEFSVQNILC